MAKPFSIFQHVPRVEARAAGIALGVGVSLTSLKFFGYFLTGSAVIFADAMESLVNLAAAIFALYSLAVAHRPADESHPYGHGKIEFLAAGFEGGMILLAAVLGIVKAIEVLRSPPSEQPQQQLMLGILLMVLALVVNGGVGWYLLSTGRRHNSLTLESDGHHLLSDAWTSIGAVVALGIVHLTGWWWLDAAAAFAVSVYIAWVGWGLVRRAEAGLTDRQDPADAELLARILDNHLSGGTATPTICGYHKLRHRHTGRYHWIDFHLQVPSEWDVRRGHEVATAIEMELQSALGDGSATAHVEPCKATDCSACHVHRRPA